MILSVYAVRDIHTGFLSPTVDQNDETAKRNFAFMINNNPGVIAFRPADFDLYLIGSFDSENGLMVPLSPVELIANGAAMIGE